MGLSDVLNAVPDKGSVRWRQVRYVILGVAVMFAFMVALDTRIAAHITSHEARGPHSEVVEISARLSSIRDTVLVINIQQKTIMATQARILNILEGRK